MLKAFCDESSDGRSERIYVVAGYFGDEEQLKRLDTDWKARLSESNLSEFHMSDCEAGRKEYPSLHRNERAVLQRDLISIISNSGVVGVSVALDIRAYNDLLPELKPFLIFPPGRGTSGHLREPYFLPFKLAVEQICMNISNVKLGQDVEMIFDRKESVQGRATGLFEGIWEWEHDWIKKIGRVTLSFADKSEFTPLQAADVLAYESFRWVDVYLRKGRTERWQWNKIKTTIKPNRISLLDRDGLSEVRDLLKARRAEAEARNENQSLPTADKTQ